MLLLEVFIAFKQQCGGGNTKHRTDRISFENYIKYIEGAGPVAVEDDGRTFVSDSRFFLISRKTTFRRVYVSNKGAIGRKKNLKNGNSMFWIVTAIFCKNSSK